MKYCVAGVSPVIVKLVAVPTFRLLNPVRKVPVKSGLVFTSSRYPVRVPFGLSRRQVTLMELTAVPCVGESSSMMLSNSTPSGRCTTTRRLKYPPEAGRTVKLATYVSGQSSSSVAS